MKIALSTPDRVVLTRRPWGAAGFVGLVSIVALWSGFTGAGLGPAERCLVLALGAGGLWAAWRFFPFVTLVLDRQAGTATHVERRLAGTTITTLPLDRIDRVAAQRECEGTPAERLVFVTGEEVFPLETGFSSAPRGPLADRLNDWLGPDPR